MAGAHRVDVVLLHKADIPHHVLFGHGPPPADVKLMAVNPLKHDPFPVKVH